MAHLPSAASLLRSAASRGGLAFGALVALWLLGMAEAAAQCSSAQRRALRDDGWTDRRIDAFCGGEERRGGSRERRRDDDDDFDDWDRNDRGRTPRQPGTTGPGAMGPGGGIATICVTQMGPCPMQVPVPSGAPCFCAGMGGMIPGQAR